jgi:HMG (high mobility group) box/HMG-box domain
MVYRNKYIIKNMKINTINSFVSKIICDHPDIVEQWESDATQKKLKALVNRSEGKRVKDPLAPKNAKSAYIFFCNEMRDKVKSELEEGSSTTDITKALGARWKTTKEKGETHIKKFVKMAEEDKKRYEKEKSFYVPSEEFLIESRRGKKDPNAPKHPQSAYIIFCNEKRAEVKKYLGEESSATDVTKELGLRWRNLKESTSKKDKELMERLAEEAKEDKERYETEKSRYEREHGTAETKKSRAPAKPKAKASKASEKKPATKAKTTANSKKADSKPADSKGSKKPAAQRDESSSGAKSGYQIFSTEHKQSVKDDNPEMKMADVNKILSQMWKDLSADEQQAYKDQV